jgi:hypothetical protein
MYDTQGEGVDNVSQRLCCILKHCFWKQKVFFFLAGSLGFLLRIQSKLDLKIIIQKKCHTDGRGIGKVLKSVTYYLNVPLCHKL